jgi:hypothetical protein
VYNPDNSAPAFCRILKISLLLPFYAIFSFLSVVFPKASTDLGPWLDFVQAISLGAFFLLMGQFVSPSDSQRDLFFAALLVKDKKSPTGQGNGLYWFRVSISRTGSCAYEESEREILKGRIADYFV